MGEFDKKLKGLKKDWKEATKRTPEFGEFPLEDGRYVSNVTGAELGESNSGRLQAVLTYTVAEGESEGVECKSYHGLDNENGIFYFQQTLARLGKEIPEDPAELEDVLAEIADEQPLIKMKVVTKGEFTNVYIDKLLDADGGETKKTAAPKKGAASKKGKAAEEVAEEPAGEDDGMSWADLEAMDEKELTKLCKDAALDTDPKDYKKDADGLRAAIAEELGIEVEEATEEAGEGEGLTVAEVNEMDWSALVSMCKESELDTKPAKHIKKGKKDVASLRAAIIEELGLEEEAVEDDEVAEVTVGTKVVFEKNGKELEGTVVSVDEETGVCKVKVAKIIHKVNVDELAILPNEDDKD